MKLITTLFFCSLSIATFADDTTTAQTIPSDEMEAYGSHESKDGAVSAARKQAIKVCKQQRAMPIITETTFIDEKSYEAKIKYYCVK